MTAEAIQSNNEQIEFEFVAEQRAIYEADVDLLRLASIHGSTKSHLR